MERLVPMDVELEPEVELLVPGLESVLEHFLGHWEVKQLAAHLAMTNGKNRCVSGNWTLPPSSTCLGSIAIGVQDALLRLGQLSNVELEVPDQVVAMAGISTSGIHLTDLPVVGDDLLRLLIHHDSGTERIFSGVVHSRAALLAVTNIGCGDRVGGAQIQRDGDGELGAVRANALRWRRQRWGSQRSCQSRSQIASHSRHCRGDAGHQSRGQCPCRGSGTDRGHRTG